MARTALITGASAGLGSDYARLFASDGHNLVLVARRRERLEVLAAELEGQFGVHCTVVPTDLSVPGAADDVYRRVSAAGIEVDFLVNNAGYGTTGNFWELDPGREVDQVQVNVTALVHLTRLFLPGMVDRKFGRVLNIASTAGFQPGPYMATYYATKAFVISFTEAIAYELKGTGVTATAHCPGATATEFGAVSGNDKSNLFQKGAVATSEEVALHGYRAMRAGKFVSVHGALNSAGAAGVRLTPRSVLRALAARVNSSPDG